MVPHASGSGLLEHALRIDLTGSCLVRKIRGKDLRNEVAVGAGVCFDSVWDGLVCSFLSWIFFGGVFLECCYAMEWSGVE